MALLEGAVSDYHYAKCHKKKLARVWFYEDNGDDRPFSYLWVCGHLGIEPYGFRKLAMADNISSFGHWKRTPSDDTRQSVKSRAEASRKAKARGLGKRKVNGEIPKT